MTDEELLSKVKVGLNITGTYQDETLKTYISDVKNFLADAGVPEKILNNSDSVGVIIRGVSDLWNYGMGNAELSQYFIQRAVQLVYKSVPDVLGTLKAESTAGSTIGTTKITIADATATALYKYSFTDVLPEYNQNLTDWFTWDCVSDIVAEDGHKMCIVEVTEESLAIRASVVTVVSNLG